MTANPLWDVIQAYMDSPLHEYTPRPADLARKTGVSEQVLSKWKSRPTLPTPGQMVKIADGTGLSYAYLLEAALQGKGFLPLVLNPWDDVQEALDGPQGDSESEVALGEVGGLEGAQKVFTCPRCGHDAETHWPQHGDTTTACLPCIRGGVKTPSEWAGLGICCNRADYVREAARGTE